MIAKSSIFFLLSFLFGQTLPKTQHWWEAERHRKEVEERQPSSIIKPSPLRLRKLPSITREIYGYNPYWVDERWFHYDLLTRIGLFDVTLEPDGSITNAHNFPGRWARVIDRAHRNGVKCEMVATCFGWWNIHQAIRAPAAIPNLVALAESSGVDGINIDFEDILSSDRDTVVLFMQRLSAACRASGLELTMATMPLDFANAYDFRALAETTDGLFIMGYNFHWQSCPEAGPVAPLFGWEYYGNLQMTLNEYLNEIGNGRKLYLGVPYYGFQWRTLAETTHSRTSGPGEVIYYAEASNRAREYGYLWDEESQTPWYRFHSGVWNQGWFDDDSSLFLKYQEVHEHDLLGAGIWALGYDGPRRELWATLRESFNRPQEDFTNGDCEIWQLDTSAVPSDTSPNPVGWYEGRKAQYQRETEIVRTGSASIRHIPDSLGYPWPVTSRLFQDVLVTPGLFYEFSGWSYKNDHRGNRTYLLLQWFDSTHRVIGSASSQVLSTDSASWRFLTTGRVIAPPHSQFARLFLLIEGWGGADFWDDLDFSPGNKIEETTSLDTWVLNLPTVVHHNLRMPLIKSNYRVELLSATGQKVMDLSPGGNNISFLPAGIYFIKINPGNIAKKIILAE